MNARRARLLVMTILALTSSGCERQTSATAQPRTQTSTGDKYEAARRRMVDHQLRGRDITDPRVLAAMNKVPRHEFVPENMRESAYEDFPLPIGLGQTISQPYIVAYMTQALELKENDKVLEIGTGSGYQAAVLGELVRTVYTIEILPELAARASETLKRLGYRNVNVRAGDGYAGWPEQKPFNKIIVTAAPEQVPQALIDQLAERGTMVAPVGSVFQEMTIIRKTSGGVTEQKTMPVRFVPMIKKRPG